MPMRPLLTILAGASITAIIGLASAQAMPIAAIAQPSVSDAASGAAVAPGTRLVQEAAQYKHHGHKGGRGQRGTRRP
ncbi:hypothetical protein SAMN05444161_3479 [Rhizobiales bacterium GAS191]|jgi:hypothetical protein|nr:hypothetical protein SAMN05519103_02646 [Rhizobiales bacterium GAS113]SED56307.1 hypothetical protein SAMN05444161_3479 [Rhizobiales bacterium GAS191]SEE79137.1 hypothetical protein SAMN05519104_7500 [Rhizobiales bacterium GAS188]